MAYDFPNTPVVGQVVSVDGVTRRWDGTTWKIIATTITGPTGATGPAAQIFIQGSEPTTLTTGNFWLDTSTTI